MTLILSEKDVESFLEMDDVVAAVEEAFRRQGMDEAQNYMRTRTRGSASVLNVMHANNSYLRRGGLKAYMSSSAGTKFLVVLFDSDTSVPLAVMGADLLGRYRTGAASGVATRHLYRKKSGTVALFGSGKQSLTQALALESVMGVEDFRVWSPNRAHREAFARALVERGFRARAYDNPQGALAGADVATAITSSREPFIGAEMLGSVSHVNICGGNVPDHAEVTADGIGLFDSVVVDDLQQSKMEYGDLIQAARAGRFDWGSAMELGQVVAGRRSPKGKTLFKSGGAAIEDVAAASLVYLRAKETGRFPDYDLV